MPSLPQLTRPLSEHLDEPSSLEEWLCARVATLLDTQGEHPLPASLVPPAVPASALSTGPTPSAPLQPHRRSVDEERGYLPRIGLLAGQSVLRNGGWTVYGGDAPTMHAVTQAGGLPLTLPAVPLIEGLDPFDLMRDPEAFRAFFDAVWTTLSALDGLIFTGGGDLDARFFYGEAPHPRAEGPDLWRDVWEWCAALIAWVTCLPTLGICRGMQLMNVVRGGRLVQDQQDLRRLWHAQARAGGMPPLLAHRRGRPVVGNFVSHPLLLMPAGWLATAVRGEDVSMRDDSARPARPPRRCVDAVLSQHHQFVGLILPGNAAACHTGLLDSLAPGMVIAGYAPDGVIEAIADRDPRRVFVGVQFHPEYDAAAAWAMGIFRYHLVACQRASRLPRARLTLARNEIACWLWRSAEALVGARPLTRTRTPTPPVSQSLPTPTSASAPGYASHPLLDDTAAHARVTMKGVPPHHAFNGNGTTGANGHGNGSGATSNENSYSANSNGNGSDAPGYGNGYSNNRNGADTRILAADAWADESRAHA